VATAVTVWIAFRIERGGNAQRRAAAAAALRDDQMADLARRLASDSADEMSNELVDGAAQLLSADMAVLTVLDPSSGRHYVRATRGGGGSAVGVEVTPGVGITGQAIRDQRLVVSGADPTSLTGLQRRLDGGSGAHSMAAVPGLQAGRVITSITVGRGDGSPFDAADQHALEQIGALAALAIAVSLARSEAEEGKPREALTGLFNRAYLDAALEQTVALRRRTAPDKRPPLAMIMFDIDGLAGINERHGRQAGDQVLRAVATLLRQRFRASDIVARSGDSFFVVLNGASSDTAEEAAALIRRRVSELHIVDARGVPVVVSISAGCAVMQDGDTSESLIHSVEAALKSEREPSPEGTAST